MEFNPRRRALLMLGVTAAVGGLAACTGAVRGAVASPAGSTPSGPVLSGTPSTSAGTAPTRVGGPASSKTGPSTTMHTTAHTSARPSLSTSSTPRSTAPPAAEPGAPARQVDHATTGRPEIALTFHGAGELALARQILTIAAGHRARITVMAVGTWLADNPGIGREILAAGHELGNHTWSHQDINSLSRSDQQSEILRCRDVLKTVGVTAGLFRQSQSQTASGQLRALAGAAGYPICLSYDVDSMDYTDPGADVVRANVRAARAGSVVSMHLGHQDTVDALPGILADLKRRGLSAVTGSALLST